MKFNIQSFPINSAVSIFPLNNGVSLKIKYSGLIEALFYDVNPVPVKQAMNLLGLDVGPCRLPLYPMNESNLNFLKEKLIECGLKF